MSVLAIEKGSFLNSHTDRGVSEDAIYLRRQFTRILEDIFQSIAIGDPHRELIAALEQAVKEALSNGWDGYGARAVEGSSYAQAKRFLGILPTTLPTPEVTVNPSGKVLFEWNKGPNKVFTVSIGNNELIYAGIFGSNRTHGTEYFGDELPETIVVNLRRLSS